MLQIKADVFNALVQLAKAYGKDSIPQERLEIYTEFLAEELTVEELRRAFGKILSTCKFFPSIAEIIDLAKPKTDNEEAILIANRILECARSFSYHDTKGARKFLGEYFAIAERYGWRNLVELQNGDLQSARAQLRELSKAHLNFRKNHPASNLNKLCSSEVSAPLLRLAGDTLPIAGRE